MTLQSSRAHLYPSSRRPAPSAARTGHTQRTGYRWRDGDYAEPARILDNRWGGRFRWQGRCVPGRDTNSGEHIEDQRRPCSANKVCFSVCGYSTTGPQSLRRRRRLATSRGIRGHARERAPTTGRRCHGSATSAAGAVCCIGVQHPRMAFSEVLAFDLNGEAIHFVHQKPGYSSADSLVHFHVGTTVYWDEVFPGGG